MTDAIKRARAAGKNPDVEFTRWDLHTHGLLGDRTKYNWPELYILYDPIQVPADITKDNVFEHIPRHVYYSDRAFHFMLLLGIPRILSDVYTAAEIMKSSANGKVLLQRPNRGLPALTRDGKVVCWNEYDLRGSPGYLSADTYDKKDGAATHYDLDKDSPISEFVLGTDSLDEYLGLLPTTSRADVAPTLALSKTQTVTIRRYGDEFVVPPDATSDYHDFYAVLNDETAGAKNMHAEATKRSKFVRSMQKEFNKNQQIFRDNQEDISSLRQQLSDIRDENDNLSLDDNQEEISSLRQQLSDIRDENDSLHLERDEAIDKLRLQRDKAMSLLSTSHAILMKSLKQKTATVTFLNSLESKGRELAALNMTGVKQQMSALIDEHVADLEDDEEYERVRDYLDTVKQQPHVTKAVIRGKYELKRSADFIADALTDLQESEVKKRRQ